MRTVELGLGLRFALSLNRVMDVAPVLDGKRASLAEHRSQTVRLSGRDDWWTLGDVCEGEWAWWFFEGREWFRRSAFGGG